MSYRDELGAAQSRIESLERELKGAKDELESRALIVRPPDEIANRPGQKAARRWLGASTRFRGERIIEGVIDDSVYAAIVECISEILDVSGRSSIVPGRLEWVNATSGQNGATAQTSISVTVKEGKTVIRGEVRLGNLAGAIYGGVGGGFGLGGIMAPGSLFFLSPVAGIVGVAAWLGSTYWACRKLFSRSSKKREKQLDEVLDALEAIVRRAAKPAE